VAGLPLLLDAPHCDTGPLPRPPTPALLHRPPLQDLLRHPFLGTLRSSSPGNYRGTAAAGGRKRGLTAKGWREVAAAIDEEGAYDEIDEKCRCLTIN
jgi:hypothetical protein